MVGEGAYCHGLHMAHMGRKELFLHLILACCYRFSQFLFMAGGEKRKRTTTLFSSSAIYTHCRPPQTPPNHIGVQLARQGRVGAHCYAYRGFFFYRGFVVKTAARSPRLKMSASYFLRLLAVGDPGYLFIIPRAQLCLMRVQKLGEK